MRRVIGGKIYDTETAELVCNIDTGNTCDFGFVRADIYKTRNGRFFAAGRGGARSMFSRHDSDGSSCGSSGIAPLDLEQARAWAEKVCTAELIEQFFPVTEA